MLETSCARFIVYLCGHDAVLYNVDTSQAYYEGIKYPKNLLITYGWYGSDWWKGSAISKNFNCTAEQRSQVLAYSLAPRVQETYTTVSAPDVTGIVS